MAAAELQINYSTAKTIFQTFKCQKRFAKKPKRSLTSLRSRKREGGLRRTLTARTLPDIFVRILAEEVQLDKCLEIVKDLKPGPRKRWERALNASTISQSASGQPSEVKPPPPFCESGPKAGQISRGTDVPVELVTAKDLKDVFYVCPIEGPEAIFKHKIDYSVPMKIRTRKKRQQPKLPPLPPLPPFDVATTELSEVKELASEVLPKELSLTSQFDLSWYKAAIAHAIHNR